MANDPTVKAGSWGPKTVEKILRIQERALKLGGADGLPGRFGRRADHRPGADVPGPPRRRADLPQRGRALRPRAAGLPAVRPLGGGRRLHPRLLRRRDHARGQRLDVPRLAANGRDGDRRDGDARGDGRGEDAHRRLGLRPLPGQDATPRRSTSPSATSPTCRRNWRESPPAAPPAEPDAERAGLGDRPRRREDRLRRQGADRGAHRRRLVLRGARALGEGAGRRLRAPRRPRDRRSSPTSRSTRAACCSSTPPTRRRGSS